MAVILVLSVLYPNGAFQNSGLSYITVTATGTNYSYPQAATLYVSMNGTGSTSAIASSNLSLTLSEFNYTVAKYIGNNSSRISTESYSLQKQWNSSKYVAVETVSVYIPQVQNVTALLSTLSVIQNVYINQVSAQLTVAQTMELSSEALAQALSNASAQAMVLSGNRAVRIRNITVSRNYVYPFQAYTNGAAASSTQLFFNGRKGVQEQVTVLYSYS